MTPLDTRFGWAASPTVIVFEDDEIRVIWHPSRSQYGLVIFGDSLNLARDHRFFGEMPAKKAGLTAVAIMAKRRNWFPAASIRAAQPAIAALLRDVDVRIAYGASMGGYAAVKHSALLQATHVIALCPQWSIDAGEWDGVNPGWQRFFHPSLRGMGIRPGDAAGRIYLFADPYSRVDGLHCERIMGAAPDARFIHVPRVGHHVTPVFAGTSNLLDLIACCLADDEPGLRAFSRRTRRAHWIPRLTVKAAAIRRKVRRLLRRPGGRRGRRAGSLATST